MDAIVPPEMQVRSTSSECKEIGGAQPCGHICRNLILRRFPWGIWEFLIHMHLQLRSRTPRVQVLKGSIDHQSSHSRANPRFVSDTKHLLFQFPSKFIDTKRGLEATTTKEGTGMTQLVEFCTPSRGTIETDRKARVAVGGISYNRRIAEKRK